MNLSRPKFYLLFIPLVLVQLTHSTALGDLAKTMKPGTWEELSTNNLPKTVIDNGVSGSSLGFAENGKWDPNSRQFLFMGMDHGADMAKFIIYRESDNTWRRQPRPAYVKGNHGFDHQAIDPIQGVFYLRVYNSITIYRYVISTDSWSTLPAIPDNIKGYIQVAGGLAFFPELGGLVFVNGGGGDVFFYEEKTKAWSKPGSGLAMAQYHNFAEYNPIHKVIVFGGGNGSSDLHKLDSNKQAKTMSNAPINIGTVWGSVFTVDPVSGDYLVMGGDESFRVYDVVNDAWKTQAGPAPVFAASRGDGCYNIIASPISTYGVTMFVTFDFEDSKVFLYKHTECADRNALGECQEVPVSSQKTKIQKQTFSISVSPNPFGLKTTVNILLKAKLTTQEFNARIFDLKGRLISDLAKQSSFNGSRSVGFDWDAKGLPNGVYLLKVVLGNEKIITRLFLHR